MAPDKIGNVPACRKLNLQLVGFTLAGVIQVQALANLAGLNAYGGVVARIVGSWAPEGFDSDSTFFKNTGMAFQCGLDYIFQKILAAFARAEFVAFKDSRQLGTYCFGRYDTFVSGVFFVTVGLFRMPPVRYSVSEIM